MNRLRALRRRRGQATVELSVLCIVLVPLLMYVLFLDDLLRYKLDAAEAVFASPWDYTTVDYEAGPDIGNIQRQIRRGMCDHTTAYNSYDAKYDCNTDDVHHKALAAHSCWITKPGGQQVTCTLAKKDMGQDPFGGSATGSVKDVNKGGQISCTARLGVINYFLPQKVLQQFSKEDMTRTKHESGEVHSVAGGLGSTENYYLLERQHMSILTDTWAMTTVENVDRNGNSGVLYDRVSKAYKVDSKATDFGDKAKDDKLLGMQALQDVPPIGDDIKTAQVSFTTAAPPKVMDFFVSPWNDNAGNKVEGTYNARGSKYFGLKNVP